MADTGRAKMGAAARSSKEAVRTAALTTLLLTLFLAPATVQAQDQTAAENCAAPQARCGALISRECLSSLGAGVMALGDAESCEAQMSGYRKCLADTAARCPRQEPQQEANDAADRLDELARLGGLIEAPETVVEFYNNALVYARRGDLLSGRAMLERAIAAGARQVDLFQRYAQLLKAQEGLIGAREIMRDLTRRAPDNRAAALAEAVLRPAPRREAALRSLAENGFAPAYYEIAQLFSADRLGDRSRQDQRSEKAALEAFQRADAEGRIYRWFLEKDTVEIWRESARRRLALYQNRNLEAAPVTLISSPSNDGWIVTLQIAELAREIRYSIDDGPVKSTGKMAAINPQTGEPMPFSFINLPLGTETAALRVWYDNIRGAEEGPFTLTFDAGAAFLAHAKQTLGVLLQTWVQARPWDDGSQLIYFTTLLTQACGIEKIEYGLSREAPDQSFPVPACDPKRPGAILGDAQTYLRLARPAEFMTVRLTYRDGSTSEIRRFEF